MSIAVITKEPVNISNYVSGQEYYLYTLARVLPRFGLRVNFLTVDRLLMHARSYDEYDSYHLYYLGFKDVVRIRRIIGNSKLVYHVYHVKDVTWTKTHELSWKVFLASLQFLIDMYLATARSVYLWLWRKVPLAGRLLVEPYYECSCNSFHGLMHIVAEKFSEEREVKLFYVGRLNRYRSPPSVLLAIAKGIAERIRKRVKLTIVSKITPRKRSYKYDSGDVTLYFIDDKVSDDEKCRLYKESHFFVYLSRGNVAMNPPVTLLESVYHGTIPIVSSWILNDIEVPPELIADSVDAAIDKITSLWSDPERMDKVVGQIQKSFRRFYDVFRFIEAVRRTL